VVAEHLRASRPGSLISSGGGSLGWAGGGAVGAKLAAPDKTVVWRPGIVAGPEAWPVSW